MRLVIVGGGGFRVPLIYRALLRERGPARPTRVVLYDPDPVRLSVITAVLRQLSAESTGTAGSLEADGAAGVGGAAPEVTATGDLPAALTGADVVFAALRVGGVRGRTVDERVALRAGVLGQETVGAGGIAYGLRTVPVLRRLAELIRERAPRAWTINFTNPAGLVTEAMAEVLGDRVIGICDSPSALAGRLARALRVVPERLRVDYAGLNHLGWARRALVDGVDRLGELLADDAALDSFEEGRVFGAQRLRRLGAVPNEYLHYYYDTEAALRSVRAARQTRGEYLRDQQERFYAAAAARPDAALALWRDALARREESYSAEVRRATGGGERDRDDVVAGGYENVAVPLLAALRGTAPARLVLNVRGGGALPGLDAGAVVELPCLVDSNGAQPLAAAPLGEPELELVRRVKATERLTIEAARTGSRSLAAEAFAAHPLVGPAVAERLVADYRAASPEIAEVLARR